MDMQPLEAPWRPADAPTQTLSDRRMIVKALERKLEAAHEVRHVADMAVRRATMANDVRDIGALNKAAFGAVLAVRELEDKLKDAKRCLMYAEQQAESVRAAAAPPQGSGRLFEVSTPTGGKVRHQAASAAALQARLEPGYRVICEIAGAFPDMTGGIDADSLREWLTANGFGGSVVVLPSNNRPAA